MELLLFFYSVGSGQVSDMTSDGEDTPSVQGSALLREGTTTSLESSSVMAVRSRLSSSYSQGLVPPLSSEEAVVEVGY